MNAEAVRVLYDYNAWANRRVLDACAALGDDAFTRDLRSSFPSVRDTLAHILGAEWVWLERWHGRSPGALPPADEFPDVSSIRRRWEKLETQLGDFVGGLPPVELDRAIEYRNFRGNRFSYLLWQMLVHVVNHGSYHRGQAAAMLRQLGVPPAATDLIVYYREGDGRNSPHALALHTVRLLFEYNAWANHRALEATAALSASQFTRDLDASFRSVRDTLVHIMEVEWLYLERWRGRSPTAMSAPDGYGDLSRIRGRWAEIEQALRAYNSGLSAADLERVIEYRNTRGVAYATPLWQMLQHTVNHGTYHRGQVTMLLRQLGAQPRATDFLRYLDTLANQPEE